MKRVGLKAHEDARLLQELHEELNRTELTRKTYKKILTKFPKNPDDLAGYNAVRLNRLVKAAFEHLNQTDSRVKPAYDAIFSTHEKTIRDILSIYGVPDKPEKSVRLDMDRLTHEQMLEQARKIGKWRA